jgi:hypothetical protein
MLGDFNRTSQGKSPPELKRSGQICYSELLDWNFEIVTLYPRAIDPQNLVNPGELKLS